MHRRGRVTRLAAGAALVVASAMTAPSVARAGEAELARAREAYDRGARAEARREHAAAARAFAEADALAPSVASLEAALESAMRADDAALGAELLERAAGRASDPGLARTLAVAHERFDGRTGTIRVDCAPASSCLVAIDGTAHDATTPLHVLVGPHVVVVQRDGVRFERLVDVGAGEVVRVENGDDGERASSEAPPTRARGASPDRRAAQRGLSPVWFFVGLGATAIAGSLTVLSGLDASSKHDTFKRDGCAPDASGPRPFDCDARAEAGRSAELRTNVALGITGGVAVLTGVLGAVLVDWSGGRPTSARAPRAGAWVARSGGGAELELAW
ncbi:MAG: hypothetical protein KF764_11650 [Labilithrix sp.]|nr:hypothetical protein [Labilithrix sp.]